MDDLISIIIPIYNAAPYLEECIHSITNQTYTNWELILVDDGSTDNSGLICNAFVQKDTRIHYFYNKNQGVSFSRNFGLEHSQGNYVTFIDSDDTVESNYLQMLSKYNQYDLVVCGYQVIYKNKNKNKTIHIPDDLTLDTITSENKNKLAYLFKEGYIFPCWNKLFRRSIIIENDIKFPNYHLNEDFAFVISYLAHCKSIQVINQYYYNWMRRSNQSGVTALPHNTIFIYTTAYRNVLNYFKSNTLADYVMYPTFYILFDKVVNKYMQKELDKKDTFKWLNDFINDSIIRSTVKSYSPQIPIDKIYHFYIKHRLWRLFIFTKKIISTISH